jgi:ADP-heptose:LPS heptosyltransferase
MLLGENNKGIAPLLPVQCETIVYRKHFFKDWSMLRKLRKRNIDVLIDLMDNPSATSSILTAAIGAKYSIGIEKDNAPSYNVLVPQIDRKKFHIARRIAELLRPFSIDPESVDLKPQLLIEKQNKVEGRIGVNISVGKPSCWVPPQINAEICKALANDKDVSEVFVFAHPKSKAEQDEIIRAAANSKVKAAPVTYSYFDFAKEIASCEFLLTPDTSVVHLAAGLEIPMVAYYPPSPPDLHYWTPLGVPYEMIVKNSMPELTAAEVMDAFRALRQKCEADVALTMEVAA